MKSRLVLTLWLVGAVLYAGSTVFLAHAVLGGSAPADKGKSAAIAAAAGNQCQNVAAADAKPSTPAASAKDAASEPQKTAALEPKAQEPAPAPSAAKPAAPTTARNDAPSGPMPGADQRSAEDDPSSDDLQGPDTSSPDGTPPTDGTEQQDAMGPGPNDGAPEKDEWARVVAGTADMRSEPSMQAQLIYALPAGWQVRVISRQPGWVQVQDANSGAAGWVESSAIAPLPNEQAGPGAHPGYGQYPGPYDPRYAEEGYPYPPPPWRRPPGPFGDFLRRTFGGF
ncbi:MAG TPA: SH3 domain-containing protein [Hyphomicrobiaceae bacterium]|nr:SH3 domain-containing protein [Hyphomicrobiaceae bacterium]